MCPSRRFTSYPADQIALTRLPASQSSSASVRSGNRDISHECESNHVANANRLDLFPFARRELETVHGSVSKYSREPESFERIRGDSPRAHERESGAPVPLSRGGASSHAPTRVQSIAPKGGCGSYSRPRSRRPVVRRSRRASRQGSRCARAFAIPSNITYLHCANLAPLLHAVCVADKMRFTECRHHGPSCGRIGFVKLTKCAASPHP